MPAPANGGHTLAGALPSTASASSLIPDGAPSSACLSGLEAELIGRSLDAVRKTLRELARTPISFLLVGPTGSGKDQAARACHQASGIRDKPFFSLNCASIPENLFESQLFGHRKGAFTGADCEHVGILEAAEGGFVLLNEITETPLSIQVKLLQAIESKVIWRLGDSKPRNIDVWIAAATNRTDVLSLCAEGLFRRDLYHRLARVVVRTTPLSERQGDLPDLIVHFIELAARTLRRKPIDFKAEALGALKRYAWPGNVRELENLVHALTLTNEGATIGSEMLPGEFVCNPSAGRKATIRRDAVRKELIGQHWNVTKAAKLLGISREHLHFLIRKYELARPAKRRAQSI